MSGREYIAHTAKLGLGYTRMLFSASPYESTPTPGDRAIYNYTGLGRRDARWVGSGTSGNGWEHHVDVVGNRYRRDTIFGGRAFGISITETTNTNVNPLDGGFKPLGFSTDTVNLYGIIKDDGGIGTNFPGPGVQQSDLSISTPDYSLGKQRTPRFPYLLQSVAQAERLKWAEDMDHSQAKLGFISTIGDNAGVGFSGDDPLGGFGYIVDESRLDYSGDMAPQPANEKHFLSQLSTIYAATELLNNHTLMNGRPIYQAFDFQIDADVEDSIVSIDIGDGSPNSAFLSALREGNWRYWWDYGCKMWLIRDYCNPGRDRYAGRYPQPCQDCRAEHHDTARATAWLSEGQPGLCRGVWSSPAITLDTASQTTALKNWKIAPNKATYPVGQGLGLGGDDVSMKGAHLSKLDIFTQGEYNRLSQKARVQISGFPYICWAVKAYNHPVYLTFPPDPEGSFKGVTSGLYSLEEVQIEPQDLDGRGGGYIEATLTFQEIIAAV
jgi:hypothetical protein